MNRKFKGVWLPKELWLEKDLNLIQKGLLAEIDSLDNGDDGCVARNKYFADFFGCSETNISNNLTLLEEKGYISRQIVYFKDSKQVQKRHLKVLKFPGECRDVVEKEWRSKRNKNPQEINNDTPLKILNHPIQKSESPYSEIFKDNNTISINTLLDKFNELIFEIEKRDAEIDELENGQSDGITAKELIHIQKGGNSLSLEERLEMNERYDAFKDEAKRVVEKERNSIEDWKYFFKRGRENKIDWIAKELAVLGWEEDVKDYIWKCVNRGGRDTSIDFDEMMQSDYMKRKKTEPCPKHDVSKTSPHEPFEKFDNPELVMRSWSEWVAHKKESKKPYGSKIGEKKAVEKLLKFSNGSSLLAKEILDTAMTLPYGDFYEPKEKPEQHQQSTSKEFNLPPEISAIQRARKERGEI